MTRDAVAIAIVAAVMTVALVPVLPAGLPILAAVVIGGGVTWFRRRRVVSDGSSPGDEDPEDEGVR